MSVFIIAAVDKLDLELYKSYSLLARESLAPYGGSIVATDDAPVLIEGTLPGRRVVLLKFANDAEFERWWHSAKYQEAIPFRHAGATTHFIMKVQAAD